MRDIAEQPWFPPFVQCKLLVRHATPRTVHYQQPGMFVTPAGDLLAFAALDDNPTSSQFSFGGTQSQHFRSSNNGITWTSSSVFTGYGSEMFAVGSDLYWVHMDEDFGSIRIAKSTDDGNTWGTATTLLNGGTVGSAPNYYSVPSIPVITGGRVYLPITDTPNPNAFATGAILTLLHASTSADLLNAASWTQTSGVTLSGGVTTGDADVGFWEPQMLLDLSGNAKIITRVQSDLRINLSAVVDVTLGPSASLGYNTSTGLRTMTGGHVLFRVGIDPVSNQYLAIVTRNTEGNSTITQYRQRTVLSLIKSSDLTTWTHVTDIVRARNHAQEWTYGIEGYQYVQWLFQGSDIIGVIRVGEKPFAINYHQATALYFFRIKDYYANLLAPAPSNSGVSPASPYSAVTRNGKPV